MLLISEGLEPTIHVLTNMGSITQIWETCNQVLKEQHDKETKSALAMALLHMLRKYLQEQVWEMIELG